MNISRKLTTRIGRRNAGDDAGCGFEPPSAADHLDAPDVADGRRRVTATSTICTCSSRPGDAGNSVLIMTVNPFAGVMNPFGTTSPTTFGTDVDYQFEIDNDGDAVPDITLQHDVRCPAVGGQQSVRRQPTTATPFAAGFDRAPTTPCPSGGMVTAGPVRRPVLLRPRRVQRRVQLHRCNDTFAGAARLGDRARGAELAD